MRTGFLECFAGVSGDMMLGALVGAGVPVDLLEQTLATLDIGARLHVSAVDRSGIQATKVDVLVGELPADAVEQPHFHTHDDTHSHAHGHSHEHSHSHDHDHVPKESRAHAHTHGRSWRAIHALISDSALPVETKTLALSAFHNLAEAEGHIHGMPAEDVHFHEVGSVDAIADIVCSAAGLLWLGVDRWIASPINVGSGMIECAHGLYPVPAPATAELLRGMPTYSAGPAVEMVTPTGAALLRALTPSFTRTTLITEKIGYGAGTRNPARFPNVLRLTIGTDSAATVDTSKHESVTVLECALDDATPQLLAHVMEQAIARGALDVMSTPVTMKKGRLGTLLTVLAPREMAPSLQTLLLRETTTLGLRVHEEERVVLARRFVTVTTAFGPIAMKVAENEANAMPEFEDCRRAALAHDVPLKQVQQAAIAAYLHDLHLAGVGA